MMIVYKSPKEIELIEKLNPIVESLQYELRDVEIKSSQGGVVRVTIDVKDRSRGVNLDDCTQVHRAIDPLFDVWDPISSSYTLEVSSPGEKAPMRLDTHFEEAMGQNIEFRTREAIKIEGHPTAAPRKNWKVKLVAVDTARGVIEVEDNLGHHVIDTRLVEGARWLRNWAAKAT